MSANLQELAKWFKERPLWLQEAVRRALLKGSIDQNDLKELLALCRKEAGIEVEGPELNPNPIPEGAFSAAEMTLPLRLISISDVKGVNALAPRKPLEFGREPLTIIYGQNSSGKSGYMRLLKHVCGAREQGVLHGNVFEEAPKEKGCKITCTVGIDKKEIPWTPAIGVHQDLSTVELYDTECAHVYVNKENEVAYEPGLLSLFRVLVEVCENVDGALGGEINGKVSAKPSLPLEFLETESGGWYEGLSSSTSDAEIASRCLWDDQTKQDLASLNQRLAEANPTEKAKALRTTKRHLVDFVNELQTVREQLSKDSCAAFVRAKTDARVKRQASNVDAKKVFENAPLEGIGSESWKLLWEQARAYSEEEAYKQIPFPNTGDGAKCVLCQQPLDEDAKKRLVSFESFVKGNLETAAAEAEKLVESLLDNLPSLPSEEDLHATLDLSGVTDDAQRKGVREYCDALQKRKDSLLKAKDESELQPLPDEGILKLARLSCIVPDIIPR